MYKISEETGARCRDILQEFSAAQRTYPTCLMIWYKDCPELYSRYAFPKAMRDKVSYWELNQGEIYDNEKLGDHLIPHLQCGLCNFVTLNIGILYT